MFGGRKYFLQNSLNTLSNQGKLAIMIYNGDVDDRLKESHCDRNEYPPYPDDGDRG